MTVNAGPWLTVADVAESEGVSPRTVLRWIEQGHLRARRQPGGRLRIHSDWYEDMIEQDFDAPGVSPVGTGRHP
jgi:excisionase family DNA binding protein